MKQIRRFRISSTTWRSLPLVVTFPCSCSRFFENEPDEICEPFELKRVLRPISSKITLAQEKEKRKKRARRKQARRRRGKRQWLHSQFYNCYLAEDLKKECETEKVYFSGYVLQNPAKVSFRKSTLDILYRTPP